MDACISGVPTTHNQIYAMYFDDFEVLCRSQNVMILAYISLQCQGLKLTMHPLASLDEAADLIEDNDAFYISLGPIFAFPSPTSLIISDVDATIDQFVYCHKKSPQVPVLLTCDAGIASDFIHEGIYGKWKYNHSE
ncbi:hypothetical protein Hypma_013367, partial [Hypsizygus marmoreus]